MSQSKVGISSTPFVVGSATTDGITVGYFKFNTQANVANRSIFHKLEDVAKYFTELDFSLYKSNPSPHNKKDGRLAILEAGGLFWEGIVDVGLMRIVDGCDPSEPIKSTCVSLQRQIYPVYD